MNSFFVYIDLEKIQFMIIEQYKDDPLVKKSVNCSICNDPIYHHGSIKKIGFKHSMVCNECDNEFLDEEIELMGNIFNAFGGYYGKLKRSDKHSRMMLKEIVIFYIEQGKDISKIENDVNVLHQLFLYGISLTQLTLELVLIN